MCPESGKIVTSKFRQCCLYFSTCSGLSRAPSAPPPIGELEILSRPVCPIGVSPWSLVPTRAFLSSGRGCPLLMARMTISPPIRPRTWDTGRGSLGGPALRQVLDAERRSLLNTLLRETSPRRKSYRELDG